MAPTRVLMVCTGNTCRSPMAEGLVRQLAAEAGLAAQIKVGSAGIAAEAGGRADPRAVAAAARRGLDMARHRTRRLEAADLARHDLVVVMDRRHLAAVRRLAPDAPARLLMSYAPDAEGDEVADPIAGNPETYQATLARMEPACRGLLAALAATRTRPRR